MRCCAGGLPANNRIDLIAVRGHLPRAALGSWLTIFIKLHNSDCRPAGMFRSMNFSAKRPAQLRPGTRSRREGQPSGDRWRPVRDTLADSSVRCGQSLK